MAVLSILSAPIFVHADTIAQFTGGTGAINLATYDGQSFLVLGSGSYSDVTFNFYTPAGASYAIGTAYLFSTPYTGTPNGLSTASAALGSATSSGGEYSFGSSVTLTAGDTYYLFEDTVIPADAIAGASIGALDFYQAELPTGNFGAVPGTANFHVTGTPSALGATPVPEPSSLILLATGLLGSITARTRKRKNKSH